MRAPARLYGPRRDELRAELNLVAGFDDGLGTGSIQPGFKFQTFVSPLEGFFLSFKAGILARDN